MEKLTDSEVLARLIYRAYIAPDPHAPLEAEALLPFQAALELYARTWRAEEQGGGLHVPDDDPNCGDSCPVELPEDPPEETPAPPLREKDLDGFQPVNVKLKGADTHTQPGPLTAEAGSPSPSPERAPRRSARSTRG